MKTLILLLLSFPLLAKSDLCLEFVDNATSFVPYTQTEFSFDTDGDGVQESFANKSVGCGKNVLEINRGGSFSSLPITNANVNSYVSDASVNAEAKDSKLYGVLSVGARDRFFALTEINKEGQKIICEYEKKVKTISSLVRENKICELAEKGELERINLSDTDRPINLSGSGQPIKYIEKAESPANRCGCSFKHWTAIGKKVDSLFTREFNKLALSDGECNAEALPRERSVLRSGDKDYLLVDNPSLLVMSTFPAIFKVYPRELYRWNKNKFELVCSWFYEVQRVPKTIGR